MAIAKNPAKAEEKKVAAKPAAKSKPATTAKPAKAEPKAKKEPVAVEPTRLGRKELAAGVRERIMTAGGAISPKIAEEVVAAFEEVITKALADGNEVVLPGFGKFVTSFREARQGHNPQTGEAVEIAAKTVPAFKAGSKLKAAVNGGESEGEE